VHRSYVPVQVWFWTAYLVATHTPGISAVQLQRQLEISSDTTAWHMLHNYDTTIDVRKWHTVQAMARGCHIQVIFDEKQVLELCEKPSGRDESGSGSNLTL
jgi:uncharacterized protein YchJ